MKRPHPRSSIKNLRSQATMRWPNLPYGVLPLIILLLTLVICLVGYGLVAANVEGSRDRLIARTFSENQLRLQTEFDSYAHLLWGSVGQVQFSSSSEDSWQRFIGIYDLPRNFPGLEAVGLTSGSSPTDSTIRYVSPRIDQTAQAVGINIGQVSQLAPTMDQAARTGQVTISDPLPRLFSTKQDVKNANTGFLMFAPFYDQSSPLATPEERLLALRGYTVALFRGDIFFERAFTNVDLSHTKIKIYLGDEQPSHLLHEVGTTTNKDTRTTAQIVTLYGKTFTFVYTFDTANMLAWSLTYLPEMLAFGGLVLGSLIAGIAGYMLRSRYRRLTFEKERDINFAKDELLSLASHQLRTPATGVKQYLGMVLQGFAGDLTDQQRSYLERAYASNDRQLHVINDILHLAKLETGRIVLTERKFDIAKMIHEVVDEQRDQAKAGGVVLHLKAPSQGLIVGDSHMLWMVVENLVSNAIKYTPDSGVVSIRLIRRANRWVITVKDTGVGIARSDFSKLFKQFSRIANPRSDFVTGTGVGLYLAYHLTVLHGGTISVSSVKGKGSTFTVRLPRKL